MKTPARLPSLSRLVAALLALNLLLLIALLWRWSRPPLPDPRVVDVSVRSTIYALPTATARVVVVTRLVEVTPRAPTPTFTMAPSATPRLTATPVSSAPVLAGAAAFLQPPAESADAARQPDAPLAAPAPAAEPPPAEPPPAESPPAESPPAELPPAEAAPAGPPPAASCPQGAGRAYDSIPVDSAPIDHPDSIHGDLNLWQRGWQPVDATLAVVDIDGPADSDPPQLAAILSDGRLPAFTSAAQVYDWNWGCGAHGCRGDLMTHREVMLLGLDTAPGEALRIPARGAQIYGGGYKALVLYAEPTRITLGYTREDSVANGYAVHLENLCVDAGLVALYRQKNAEGRGSLPALREGEVLGSADLGDVLVAVRDRGVFFDPRSRKDWWRGF